MIAGLLLGVAARADPVARVELAGSVITRSGAPVRLEIFAPAEVDDRAVLLWEVRLPHAGPFRVSVPADLGPVRLRAAADAAWDGVGPEDPQAVIDAGLVVGREDIEGLVLELAPPPGRVSRGATTSGDRGSP